ncbi:hypothetical protein, unlikely [Trypanosoma brucei gambiense DAL972]|uniref:Uncharacterized protein n=1 Tax=Trypanosoma brucei gambiense (strain MHOM/CI/86/DAL972) TaxID=679716 RepID=C9ZWC5_TRYB9|nr:hypothetical protein, unlikely [Trypanosoma brucei gambiense DAL972]CBH13714.1 hypothetical protein, unlikely [Trypanosoma brucei gambiense DAL972]|eukprot:XP_011775990.1 hypothetical protein, unlikely [Trypanosoma brucei gambiense DAL972]
MEWNGGTMTKKRCFDCCCHSRRVIVLIPIALSSSTPFFLFAVLLFFFFFFYKKDKKTSASSSLSFSFQLQMPLGGRRWYRKSNTERNTDLKSTVCGWLCG